MPALGTQVGLAGLWGGMLVIERRAFLQAMYSRPLVAATGTGLLLNELEAGIWVGIFFELLHLGSASLGGSHPEHETLPAVTAAAAAATMSDAAGGPSTPAMWALAILVFLPMGRLGRTLEFALDRRAERYSIRAEGLFTGGQLRKVARQNLWGMWPHFVTFGLLCSFAAATGPLLHLVESHFPLGVMRGLAWTYPALAAVAAAVAVHGTHAKHPRVIATLGGAGAVALALLRHGAWW